MEPDGKMILFSSNVYPGAFTDSANKKIAEARKNLKYKARVYTSFPVRDWDHWIEEKKIHLFVQSTEEGRTPEDLLTGMDSTEEKNVLIQGNACWSADSKAVLFNGIRDGGTRARQEVPTYLYKADVNKGISLVIKDSLNSYTSPAA